MKIFYTKFANVNINSTENKNEKRNKKERKFTDKSIV